MDSNIGDMSGKAVRVSVIIKKANGAADHTHKTNIHHGLF